MHFENNNENNLNKYSKRVKSICFRCYVLLKILVNDYNYIAIIQRRNKTTIKFRYFPIIKIFNEKCILLFDINNFTVNESVHQKFYYQRICLNFLISELEEKGYIFDKFQTRQISSNLLKTTTVSDQHSPSPNEQCTLTKIRWIIFEKKMKIPMELLENTLGYDVYIILVDLSYEYHCLFDYFVYSKEEFILEINNILCKEFHIEKEDIYWIREIVNDKIIKEYLPYFDEKDIVIIK